MKRIQPSFWGTLSYYGIGYGYCVLAFWLGAGLLSSSLWFGLPFSALFLFTILSFMMGDYSVLGQFSAKLVALPKRIKLSVILTFFFQYVWALAGALLTTQFIVRFSDYRLSPVELFQSWLIVLFSLWCSSVAFAYGWGVLGKHASYARLSAILQEYFPKCPVLLKRALEHFLELQQLSMICLLYALGLFAVADLVCLWFSPKGFFCFSEQVWILTALTLFMVPWTKLGEQLQRIATVFGVKNFWFGQWFSMALALLLAMLLVQLGIEWSQVTFLREGSIPRLWQAPMFFFWAQAVGWNFGTWLGVHHAITLEGVYFVSYASLLLMVSGSLFLVSLTFPKAVWIELAQHSLDPYVNNVGMLLILLVLFWQLRPKGWMWTGYSAWMSEFAHHNPKRWQARIKKALQLATWIVAGYGVFGMGSTWVILLFGSIGTWFLAMFFYTQLVWNVVKQNVNELKG